MSAAAGAGLCPHSSPDPAGPGQIVTVPPETGPGRSPRDGAAASPRTQLIPRRPDLPKMAAASPRLPPQDGGGLRECLRSRGSRPGRALETNRFKKQLEGDGCNSS